MAETKKSAPETEELRKSIARFTKQGDRGTALVAAAWLDDALEVRIRAAFRSDKGTADDVFRPDGPLGSFAARIKIAYLLDLIEPLARRDLDLVRRIRNDFAHARSDLYFKTPRIKDRCKQLHGTKAAQLGGLTARTPKQMFIVAAYFLVEYLLSLAKMERRAHLETDGYGSWIRRRVKSASLRLLSQELARV
jgi:DNA-binding MltR family transcriptional regulator